MDSKGVEEEGPEVKQGWTCLCKVGNVIKEGGQRLQ